ncbi:MAG: response regulator [Bacteroidota bacterium]
MNIVIIDNEPAIIDTLSAMLAEDCPDVNILATADSMVKGVSLLQTLRQVDVLFLDVELGDGTGMELLEQLEQRPFQVVFITAHEKYALNAFRFSAIDFLLKPFDPDEVVAAV